MQRIPEIEFWSVLLLTPHGIMDSHSAILTTTRWSFRPYIIALLVGIGGGGGDCKI